MHCISWAGESTVALALLVSCRKLPCSTFKLLLRQQLLDEKSGSSGSSLSLCFRSCVGAIPVAGSILSQHECSCSLCLLYPSVSRSCLLSVVRGRQVGSIGGLWLIPHKRASPAWAWICCLACVILLASITTSITTILVIIRWKLVIDTAVLSLSPLAKIIWKSMKTSHQIKLSNRSYLKEENKLKATFSLSVFIRAVDTLELSNGAIYRSKQKPFNQW